MEKRAALACVEDGNGRVLAVSRKDNHEDLGFPGGKVEPHETYEEALVRELREETGCEAIEFHRVFETEDGGGYWAVAFRVTKWKGTPTSREGAAVLWVPRARLTEPSCSWYSYNRSLFERLDKLDKLLSGIPSGEPAHTCEVCHQPSTQHPENGEWPPPCCPGCACRGKAV